MLQGLRTMTLSLFAAAFALVGCLVAPSGDSGDSDPGDTDQPQDEDEAPLPSAYFMLHAADTRTPGWPDDWAQYTLFICNPTIPAHTVAEIRAARPDATLLAYTNVADLHIGQGSPNPYWVAMEAVFDTTLCVRNLLTGNVIRLYPDLPYFVMRKETADILVAFHSEVTMAAGFDGLYLDNCTASVPQWRIDDLLEASSWIDYDNDGVGDLHTDIPAVYETWRPYYTEQLRAAVGDDVLLIANSAGALDDSVLNGITLEGVGARFDREEARDLFNGQASVGRSPFLGVGWVTSPDTDEPTRSLVPEVPNLYYGHIRPELLP